MPSSDPSTAKYCALLLCLSLSSPAFAQGYRFTNIADSTNGFKTFGQGLSVNNNGTVAFTATVDEGRQGVYTSDGTTIKTIAERPGVYLDSFQTPSINDNGYVVFKGTFSSVNALYLGKGDGVLTPLIDDSPRFSSIAAETEINNNDRVAFSATFDDQHSVYTIAKDTLKTQIVDLTTLGLFASVDVQFNKPGQLAFSATGSGGRTIYLWSDGKIQNVVNLSDFGTPGETYSTGVPGTVYLEGVGRLNDQGVLAFEILGPDLVGKQIYTIGPGGLTKVIDTQTSPFGALQKYSINNNGTVAFYAVLDNPTFLSPQSLGGIYVGPDPIRDKVIAIGDPLFGSTPYSLGSLLDRRFMNDSGQIAFRYELNNGVTGIALATPIQSSSTLPTLFPNGLAHGATYLPGVVAGSWALVKGNNLSTTTRIWQASDFDQTVQLPTSLEGVQVTVNGLKAAVYYVSPGQVSFQVPNISAGPVRVTVIRNGVASNEITDAAVLTAPGLFTYAGGDKIYASALLANTATIIGDPAVFGSAVVKAHPGDRIELFATGITSSQAGVIPTVFAFNGVSATVGTTPAAVEFAGLVGAGLFQINMVVPDLPSGDYPITIRFNASNSQANVTLPISR